MQEELTVAQEMRRAKTTPKNMPMTRATGVGIRRALGQGEDIMSEWEKPKLADHRHAILSHRLQLLAVVCSGEERASYESPHQGRTRYTWAQTTKNSRASADATSV